MRRLGYVVAAVIAFAMVGAINWQAVPGCLSGGAFSQFYCEAVVR